MTGDDRSVSGTSADDVETDSPRKSPYQRCMKGIGLGCMDSCANSCPRVHGVIVGIIFPLWFLIGVSFFFGYGLSVLETGPEIDFNDKQLQIRSQAELLANVGYALARHSPSVCYTIFISNSTVEDLHRFQSIGQNGAQGITIEDIQQTLELDQVLADSLNGAPMVNVVSQSCNQTEASEFMTDCGEALWEITKNMLNFVLLSAAPAIDDLEFNWNRCNKPIPSSPEQFEEVPSLLRTLDAPDSFISEYATIKNSTGHPTPVVQAAFYRNAWRIDQESLYVRYLELFNSTAAPELEVRFRAFLESINEASGKAACDENLPAAVWFWFTIMSTIGYGNQTPSTSQGRSLVIIAGFLSILAFAAVLGSAGYVISAIFDDALIRFRLKRLTRPWIASFFWLLVYFSWMGLVGQVYREWQEQFMNVELSRLDGYWFAFVSTTTVGFGDFFLEPEVVTIVTLITWPLYMLFGFVWFAAFAGKFTEAVGELINQTDGDTMIDRLKRTNKRWQEMDEIAEAQSEGDKSVYQEDSEPGDGEENVVAQSGMEGPRDSLVDDEAVQLEKELRQEFWS